MKINGVLTSPWYLTTKMQVCWGKARFSQWDLLIGSEFLWMCLQEIRVWGLESACPPSRRTWIWPPEPTFLEKWWECLAERAPGTFQPASLPYLEKSRPERDPDSEADSLREAISGDLLANLLSSHAHIHTFKERKSNYWSFILDSF